jgi:hypothetical protein
MNFRILAATSNESIAVSNSFNASNKSSLNLDIDYKKVFAANVQGVFVTASSISAANSLTIRVCTDSAGDKPIVPDTQATIATGLTTSDSGMAVYKVDLDVYTSAETYFVFYKTNAGSLTVDSVTMTYRRDV